MHIHKLIFKVESDIHILSRFFFLINWIMKIFIIISHCSSDFFFEIVLLSHPHWSAVTRSAHCKLHLLSSHDSPAPASWVSGTTDTCHHTHQFFFVFLVETGFHCVSQDGLDLLTSWSTRLGLPQCWDYRREPPRPAIHRPFIFLPLAACFSVFSSLIWDLWWHIFYHLHLFLE